MTLRVRAHLANIRPYEPGKPIELLQRELGSNRRFIKLASNENVLGTSPLALDAMARVLGRGHIYPDDSCYELRERVAGVHDVPMDWVRMGNGSSELIYLLGLALVDPGDNVVVSQFSFNMPKIVAEVMGGVARSVPLRKFRHDLDGLLAQIDERTRFVYLDLPMNPIGESLSRPEVDAFVARMPENVLLVCDEAYREFAQETHTAQAERFVRAGRNVIMLRTFSKLYGLAGVRVGYGIGPVDLMESLRKVSLAFSVNSIAQAGALAALDDDVHVARTLELTAAGKWQLEQRLSELGIPSIASHTNFLTIDAGRSGRDVCAELEKHGVIVRPLASYGLPNHIRVTIGTSEQNAQFLDALESLRQPSRRGTS